MCAVLRHLLYKYYVLVKIIPEVVVNVNDFRGFANKLTIASNEHFFLPNNAHFSEGVWQGIGQALECCRIQSYHSVVFVC
jgi:hypothetical protein